VNTLWGILGGGFLAYLLSRKKDESPPAPSPASVPAPPAPGMRPLTLDDYVRGCEAEAPSGSLDKATLAGFRALTPYVYLIWQVVRGEAHVRGWYRPPACNARRGGASRSRHLAGYAVDMDFTPAQTAALVDKLQSLGAIDSRKRVIAPSRWGDFVRSSLGIDENVGLKIYASGNIHIDIGCPPGTPLCDPRTSDWLVVDV